MFRAVLLAFGALCAAAASSQEYPTRAIRIVTAPAGGGNDFSARILARGISGALGQQVVVDNRPTVLAPEIVAKAASDGYTMLLNGSSHWIGPFVERVSYDPLKDFAPVSLVDRTPVILVVHPSLPVKSVKQLIALAKARPGELNFSSGAPGTSNYLGGVLFNHYAGVDIVRIPYKGAAPAMTAVMSGETQIMFASPGGSMPHVKSGRLRALAVGSERPSELAPGLPTIAESGVRGYVCETLHALFVPAGTPAAIVTRVHQEVDRYLRSPDGRDQFIKGGVEAVSSTPEQLTATMKSEMATIGKVLKAAGVTPPQ
ncbi:MAG TPA: tripartite tricarboxylate transporter substrate binding protein [Burkholderiales bacterium]|nr:tripartite tricarboxylate transporter substrate binding protein [Burkholderiales bacterium]